MHTRAARTPEMSSIQPELGASQMRTTVTNHCASGRQDRNHLETDVVLVPPTRRSSLSAEVRQPNEHSNETTAAYFNDAERGDVPGWVLITLMTAGLVVAIWAIAGPALEGLFNDAISRISSR